jgi:hypothetical protein
MNVSKKWHPLKWQPYDYNPNGDWRAPYKPNGPVDTLIAMVVFLGFVVLLALGLTDGGQYLWP